MYEITIEIKANYVLIHLTFGKCTFANLMRGIPILPINKVSLTIMSTVSKGFTYFSAIKIV